MVGIFNAKGCHGPIEHAMVDEDASQSAAAIKPAAGELKVAKTTQYND